MASLPTAGFRPGLLGPCQCLGLAWRLRLWSAHAAHPRGADRHRWRADRLVETAARGGRGPAPAARRRNPAGPGHQHHLPHPGLDRQHAGRAGFPVTASDILTAPVIAAAYLHDRYPGARCPLLSSGDITEDLAGLTLARESDPAPADVVLVGGAARSSATRRSTRPSATCSGEPGWSPCTAACTGAPARACNSIPARSSRAWNKPPAPRQRWWASPPRHSSPPRWPALAPPAGTVMVGDDIDTDVLAAQRQGLTGVLVKTGKYLPRTHRAAAGTPTMSWTPSPACPPC